MSASVATEPRHEEHRDAVRTFAEDVVADARDEAEREGALSRDLIRRVAEEGYRGVFFPEEYGGAGEDYRTFVVTLEELARVWKYAAGEVNIASCLVGTNLYRHGDERQRDEWLRGLCDGSLVGAFAMTEPDAGSDMTNVETRARLDGDEWVVDGHKHWCTLGSVADLLLVLARTGDGPRDLSLVGVEVDDPGDHPGIEYVRDIPNMEGPAAVESELKFDGLRVPAENLVGERDAAFRYVLDGLNVGRVGTAAQGVGVAAGAFEAAREFAGNREQFGRDIRSFQGVGFKLADMQMEISAARLLTMQAAHALETDGDAATHAATAKTYATDVAMDAAVESVQIHGARGYSTDYPVERYMREAKGMQIYEGTNEVNRQVIVNRMYD